MVQVAGGIVGGDYDYARRVGDSQRRQQGRAHQAEDGGVGADAQRQGEQGDRGESGVVGQNAQAEAQVVLSVHCWSLDMHVGCQDADAG